MSDRAFLVAINTYRSIPGLRGCLPDQRDVAELLSGSYGFGPLTIRLLGEADATKPNLLDGLRWLRDGARPGDRRLLHFSGHGSYTADLGGDEADGRDELLCLYDHDWSPGTYLLDDELRAWIASVASGVRLAVLLDSCHSGTATREVLSAVAGVRRPMGAPSALALDYGPHVTLARFVEPPAEIQIAARGVARRRKRAVNGGPDLVALAACHEDETAADAWLGGGYRGAFSYHLCRLLRARPRMGRDELLRRVSSDLARGRFEQRPQLEAMPAIGGLFGVSPRSPSAPPRDLARWEDDGGKPA